MSELSAFDVIMVGLGIALALLGAIGDLLVRKRWALAVSNVDWDRAESFVSLFTWLGLAVAHVGVFEGVRKAAGLTAASKISGFYLIVLTIVAFMGWLVLHALPKRSEPS